MDILFRFWDPLANNNDDNDNNNNNNNKVALEQFIVWRVVTEWLLITKKYFIASATKHMSKSNLKEEHFKS